jgi:hypothetical protein
MAEKKALLLRIDPELWEVLQRWARDDLRSINAQIEYLLREAARQRRGLKPDGPESGAALGGESRS